MIGCWRRDCGSSLLLIKESDNTGEIMLSRFLGEEEIEAELPPARGRALDELPGAQLHDLQ